jgi:hypothetical protein
MHRLRHQAHAQGSANATDRLKARFAAGSKRFVKGFASDAGILRNLRHSSRTGNVSDGSG